LFSLFFITNFIVKTNKNAVFYYFEELIFIS